MNLGIVFDELRIGVGAMKQIINLGQDSPI
jgi:hypothetical protein